MKRSEDDIFTFWKVMNDKQPTFFQIEPFTRRQTDILIVTPTQFFICSKSTHEWRYLLNADWNSVDGERLFRGSESCTGSVYLIRPWLNPRPQKRCSLWMFWCWKCERMNLFKVVNQQKCQNLQLKDEIKWFCAKYSNTAAAAAAQKYPEGRLVKYNIFVQNV